MKAPGGIRVPDALNKAAENLETIREDCLGALDEQLTQIERLCAEGGDNPSDTLKLEIYGISNDIVAVAGVFSLTELGEAAFSLCELIDRLRRGGGWSRAAVMVHISAFRILRNPDDQTDRSALVQGLRRVTEKTPTAAA